MDALVKTNRSGITRTWRYVSRSSGTDVLPKSAQELDGLLGNAGKEHTLKNDLTTTVARISINQRDIILKRYNPRNTWHKVKRALRKSRARRCWKMSRVFSEAGLNVSPPIMMFEDRIGLIRMNAYFANEFLSGVELLSALPEMQRGERILVKEAITEAFAKLAAAKISHGDMKATNLLWVDQRLFFIDLDAAQRHRWWSLTWQRNHNRDRRRFLKNWEAQPELLALFSNL